MRRRPGPRTEGGPPSPVRDRGVVDVSVQMMFGLVLLLFVLLLVFDTVAYWHTRNVLGEAAAEGARVAAAFDGDCADGAAAARQRVEAMASGWSSRVTVACIDGPVVSVEVGARTPGLLGGALGLWVSVVDSEPKEG